MKGAALRGGGLAVAVWLVAGVVCAADSPVTDHDRVWVNFNREAAVVGAQHFWIELRGMLLENDQGIDQTGRTTLGERTTFKGPRLGLNGYPINTGGCNVDDNKASNRCIESIDGGRFDLVGAYGLGANTELGLDLPFVMQQQISYVAGGHMEDVNVGDLVLYGKFKRQLSEHVAGALGLELSAPTAPSDNFLGSGELGLNPFLSTRYQSGRVALGGHVGFLLNTGSKPDVFNWSVETILRGNALFALRCEFNGRLFQDRGTYNDITAWPGIDLNLTENFIIRPQGLAHLTGDAIDWGLGIAFVFTM
jgi:hypothetical protein